MQIFWRLFRLGAWGVLIVVLVVATRAIAADQHGREIAITVDDLPAGNAYSMDAATIIE